MAEMLGRNVSISVGGVTVANAQSKDLTINNTLVSITSDVDDGTQRFLDVVGEKSVEVSFSGLVLDDVFLILSLNKNPAVDLVLTYPTYKISGTFVLSNYSETFPTGEAMNFSCSFSSSGAIVKAVVI